MALTNRSAARKGYKISLESKVLKYGYSNARVRAMKGFLLKGAVFSEMAKVGGIEGVVELLQRTAYKNDIAAASSMYSGSQMVESAASKNFSACVQKLMKMTPISDRQALASLLLKWDLTNLKNLLHAKKLGKSYEDIRPTLFPVGGLDEDDFKAIMKADERSIYREVKGTKLGKRIFSEAAQETSKGMLNTFRAALQSVDAFMKYETEVDTYIYLMIDKALSGSGSKEAAKMSSIIKREIDAKNILIIERLKRHNAEKGRILKSLIRGGTLNDTVIGKLIEAKDLSAVVGIVRFRFPSLTVSPESSDLSRFENALERSIAAQKIDAFYTSILSIGVIIGFLLLKEEEVNNLRKIAKGKEFGMPEEEIRDMLVIAS